MQITIRIDKGDLFSGEGPEALQSDKFGLVHVFNLFRPQIDNMYSPGFTLEYEGTAYEINATEDRGTYVKVVAKT